MLCYDKPHFYAILEMRWEIKCSDPSGILSLSLLYGTWKLNSRNLKVYVFIKITFTEKQVRLIQYY